MEKDMLVVIIDPDFNAARLNKCDAPKDYDNQHDAGIYDSNEDMCDKGNNRDDRTHDDINQYDGSHDDAIQNDKNDVYGYQDNQNATIQIDIIPNDARNDVIQNDARSDVSDDDDDTSDSGVSQVTTQEAASASPSTPRLTAGRNLDMNDDAASTSSSSSCPTLTDRRAMAESESTLPSNARLSDTEGTLVAFSGAAKESICITRPVSCGQ